MKTRLLPPMKPIPKLSQTQPHMPTVNDPRSTMPQEQSIPTSQALKLELPTNTVNQQLLPKEESKPKEVNNNNLTTSLEVAPSLITKPSLKPPLISFQPKLTGLDSAQLEALQAIQAHQVQAQMQQVYQQVALP